MHLNGFIPHGAGNGSTEDFVAVQSTGVHIQFSVQKLSELHSHTNEIMLAVDTVVALCVTLRCICLHRWWIVRFVNTVNLVAFQHVSGF
jgi:hypothetical protein